MPHADHRSDEVRGQILAAARARFARYGYAKTTMAEIARDCGMSAANLYRYFANKSDIGAAGAALWFAEAEARMATVVEKADLGPPAKLETLVLLRLGMIADLVSTDPHIGELVDHVTLERRDVIDPHLEHCHGLIAEVLAEGNRTGAFAVADCAATAATIHAAVTKFYYPDFVRVCDRALLEDEARRVVALLIAGIARH